ncbi:MAG: class I SAM-dependent methyltransferase [Proteobacteria bacterium]|nr:class I SAM-dependent methyltransferase [Pseudomonadota bacterium]MBU1739424.1 class I SAM-dependent methyltransferase [Pseudomonadota bacterium]
MRADAIALEEKRLEEVSTVDDYQAFHERHRIFPAIFEDRNHTRILDTSAGVGVLGRRIRQAYDAELLCNDICPKCLKTMQQSGLDTISFDIDDKDKPFPLADKSFDAVISLATIEHLIQIDNYMEEIRRILKDDGYLYISAPNYNGLAYLLPMVVTGKTFHDPFTEPDRYEFYAHVRYFTHRTLLDYVSAFGFSPEAVYLALPESSSRFRKLKEKSKVKAAIFRHGMKMLYSVSPRWASEPVLCFRKSAVPSTGKPRCVLM